MKRYTLFIYAALLSIIGGLSMSAQTTQDALYIFRNDGKFNAFFFGDIDRIEYSKIDTLGVEHSDYVTQEVYALDSVFRIPISAIDSVAFVTPETKYKNDVILVDKSISDHIVASDSSTWFRLSASTPSSMIPKKGDKLVIKDRSKFLPQGIGGVVDAVDKSSNGYTVKMAETDPREIYDRLVLNLAASSTGAGTRSVTDPFVENLSLPTIKGTLWFNPSGDIIKVENAQIIDPSVSLDTEYYISYEFTLKIDYLRASVYLENGILKGGYLAKQTLDCHRQEGGTLGLTGRMELPITLPGLKENKIVTPFGEISFGIGPFMEISGSLKWVNDRWFAYNINEKVAFDYKGDGSLSCIPEIDYNLTRTKNETKSSNVETSVKLSAGMFLKEEVKLFEICNVGISLGTSADLGMRAEYNDPVSRADIYAVEDLGATSPLYQKLDKDDLIHFSYYVSPKVYSKIGRITPFSVSPTGEYETFKFGYVPSIYDVKWKVDEKRPWRGRLESQFLKRNFLTPTVPYGFLVADKEKEEEVERWWSESGTGGIEYKYDHIFDELELNKDYKGYVLTKHHDETIVADVDCEFTLGAPKLEINPKKVVLPPVFDGFKLVDVVTNVYDTRFVEEADWFEATYDPMDAYVKIDYKSLPDDEAYREDVINVASFDNDKNLLLIDEIKVIQANDVLEAKPDNVEFDVKGGTEKVSLITPAENLSVRKMVTNEWKDFYSYQLNEADKTLTITVPENTTGEERVGYIEIKGTLPNGKTIYANVRVAQAGPDGQYVKFSPDMVTFGKSAGKQTLISTANFEWYYLNTKTRWTINGNDKEAWFTFDATEYDESFADGILTDKWQITVSENNWGFVREATIEVTLKDKSETLSATATITISQGDGQDPTISVSPSSVTFGVDGGTQELKITTNQPRFGYKFDDNEWLSAKAEAGGIIKLTAKANTTGAERSATITVYGADSSGEENVNTKVVVTQEGETNEGDYVGTWQWEYRQDSWEGSLLQLDLYYGGIFKFSLKKSDWWNGEGATDYDLIIKDNSWSFEGNYVVSDNYIKFTTKNGKEYKYPFEVKNTTYEYYDYGGTKKTWDGWHLTFTIPKEEDNIFKDETGNSMESSYNSKTQSYYTYTLCKDMYTIHSQQGTRAPGYSETKGQTKQVMQKQHKEVRKVTHRGQSPM